MPNAKQKIHKSRRKLLAAMSVGAAAKLPELWSRPTVASVMLPAHASGTTQCSRGELIGVIEEQNGSAAIFMGAFAVGLPAGTNFYAQFFYQGGSTAASLLNGPPGTQYASVTVTVPNTALCSGMSVNFYPAGSPNNVVCSASTNDCTTIPISTIITVVDTIAGP